MTDHYVLYKSGSSYFATDGSSVPVATTGATGPTGATGATGPTGSAGTTGATGQDGTPGLDGTPGVGVPPGGATGYVLTKKTNISFDTDWENPGSVTLPSWFQSGNGSPIPSANNVTPNQKGAVYQDLTNGEWYEALGTTSADWFAVGGALPNSTDQSFTPPPGISYDANNTNLALLSQADSWVVISDVGAMSPGGTFNALIWANISTDGNQQLRLALGSSDQFSWTWWETGLTSMAGNIETIPDASQSVSLSLGSAYHNTFGYDVLLIVVLNITVNTSGVINLGVGPTNTPTQQTLATGVTTTGFLTVPIYLPSNYYALLSTTGTITLSIAGQSAMPI